MGKRLSSQRRGRGLPRYRSPSHRFVSAARIPEFPVRTVGEVIGFADCPGHSALLMEVLFEDGRKVHLLAPEGICLGDRVEAGAGAAPLLGSVVPLGEIPEGTQIFNVEKVPGDGGRYARAGGSSAQVVSREGSKVAVRLPSKKVIFLPAEARAQVGVASGGGRLEKPLLKAGRKYYAMRARNKKWPKVRGVKMSPYNHPFGGKEHHPGKSTCTARGTPPGRKVGHVAARMTGRKSKKTVKR